jgi:phosphoribosylamine---glycine ligase
LARGIVDHFQKSGLRIFGPSREAARLESSKVFAKGLMRHADVPTAEFRVCDHPEFAKTYVAAREYPVVIKADGLAAGKGVIVCKDSAEAVAAIDRVMIREEFGPAAGRQIVIEKRMEGEELSLLALVAGRTILPLPPTQDHKAAFDGDAGPNTGGMGAYCPAPVGTPELLSEIEESVFVPTVHALKRRRSPFRGVLYAGVMQTNQGPRVLEFNARFGDPEAQPLMMRLKTDLLDLLEAVADDRLDEFAAAGLEWDPRPAVCVVLCSGGYPGKYATGKLVTGLDETARLPDVQVFHAGTKLENGHVLTDGGRVLGVTALGDTLEAARTNAYVAVQKIRFPGMSYRHDIAAKAVKAAASADVNPAPVDA